MTSKRTTRHTRARAPRAFLAALVVAALAVAGCGGGDDGDGARPRPAIEARLAADLAAQSDAVANALESGDVCTAAVRADELVAAVNDAVARGRVPRTFEDRLTSAAIGLQNEVNCPPPPAPTTVEEPEDEGDGKRGRKRGKGKNQGKGDD
jgi:hypothetical protein